MARAGSMRHRATFERKGDGARDANGNKPVGWSRVAAVWGDLRETPGRELIASGRPEARVTATLRVRASVATNAVVASDRVTIRGHLWSIIGGPIDVGGRGRRLEFRIERGGADD